MKGDDCQLIMLDNYQVFAEAAPEKGSIQNCACTDSVMVHVFYACAMPEDISSTGPGSKEM